MNTLLNIAIVGAGYVARYHIEALLRLSWVRIVAIIDPDLAAAERLAARYGIARTLPALSGLAAAPPEAVYLLTPPSTHAELCLAALAMDCHVFVEKPMAETTADCDRMIAAACSAGRVLSVNHSDRFDPVVLEALRQSAGGRCGRVLRVDILRGSEYPPYAGGPFTGVYAKGSYPFQDLGIHGLYTLEAFLGPILELRIEYRSTGAELHVPFDEWFVHARCERGVGRIHLSLSARPMPNRLLVQGTRGAIEADRFLQTVRRWPDLPGPKFVGVTLGAWANALAQAVAIPASVIRFATGRLRPSPGIQRAAAEFATALHEGRDPPVPATEGRRAIALMESACAAADAERRAMIAARLTPLRPADALVTGGGGFLGLALVRRMVSEGRSVRALVRRRSAALAGLEGVEQLVGDLGDDELVAHAVAGVPLVLHAGAAMRGGARDFEAGTIRGTRNVVEACLRESVTRLVHVSSLSVLDHAGRDAGRALTEASPYEPHPGRRGLYTQTKLEAERIVLDAVAGRGLRAVVVRPGQIFGPGAEGVTPNGVINIGGRWVRIGLDDPEIPLVYIDDVVDALWLAAQGANLQGMVFNVVDPRPTRLSAYLTAATRCSTVPRALRMPRAVMLALAAVAESAGRLLGREMPLTRYRVRSLRPLGNFDLTAATSCLRWCPRVGVEDGLRRTFGG